jgi:hypothetical protein
MIRPCQEYPVGSGNWQPSGGQGLEVSESTLLNVSDFMAMAGVLGQFHELMSRFK